MEPDLLSFLTIITALQSHSAFGVGFPDSRFKANPERHTTPLGSMSTSFLTQQCEYKIQGQQLHDAVIQTETGSSMITNSMIVPD